jgi:hypothetical protein
MALTLRMKSIQTNELKSSLTATGANAGMIGRSDRVTVPISCAIDMGFGI